MAQTILVIGATGMLGNPVARRFKQDGYAVRAMSRDPARASEQLGPGFEAVRGDVEDVASLEKALEGCTGVHINLAGKQDLDLEVRGTTNVSKVASRLGLSRISLISGCTVYEENRWHPTVATKLEAESAVTGSGVPYTIFKPTWFMESLPLFVRGRKAMLLGKQPHPYNWVAADDYARMVSSAYSKPEAENKSFTIFGPESLLMKDALEKYCSILAPEARLSSAPLWMLSLVATIGGKQELKHITSLMRYFDKVPQAGDPTEANSLLGIPLLTLEKWCFKRTKG